MIYNIFQVWDEKIKDARKNVRELIKLLINGKTILSESAMFKLNQLGYQFRVLNNHFAEEIFKKLKI